MFTLWQYPALSAHLETAVRNGVGWRTMSDHPAHYDLIEVFPFRAPGVPAMGPIAWRNPTLNH